jgi:hypothetical protein
MEEAHKGGDFDLRSPPVVGGESEEREGMDAQGGGGFDDAADGLDAVLVAGMARESAALGPAAVAVHDDGDVKRATISIRACTLHGKVPLQKKDDYLSFMV